MEFEQLIKRIDWLEKQQRQTSEASSLVEGRLTSIERDLASLAIQFKTLEKSLADLAASTSRLNQFDEIFAKQRKDMNAAVDEIDKKAQKREREVSKRHQADLEKLHRAIDELRPLTDTSDIRKQIKDKAVEEIRVTQAITDLKARVDEVALLHDQFQRSQKASDEARRTDLKRVADLQGDLSALRKRLDETRDKMQLNTDSLHVVENRMTELLSSEVERKQAQTVFIDQQSLAQVERERAWKEWRNSYDAFKKQAEALDTQVQAADEASRAAKRAQDTYLELNQKLERRINEITEMQRLAEERTRQEWVAFKADDQKRWTGYTLTQDEAIRDLRRAMTSAEERVASLDDPVQTVGSTASNHRCHRTPDAGTHELGA